jgi:hypothetical protein
MNLPPPHSHPRDPLHGRILEMIVTELVERHQWAESGRRRSMVGEEPPALARLINLTVMNLPLERSRALAQLAQPSMQLQCTIQEGQIWTGDGTSNAHIELTISKTASDPFGH